MDIWKVLEYTSSVTIVGLLIWLIKLIFYDKLDARWHYFIWLVLLVRLVVPPGFSWLRTPVSIFQGLPIGIWAETGRLTADKKGYSEIFSLLGRVYLWGAALLLGYYFTTWMILRISLKCAAKADEDTRRYVENIGAKYGLKVCGDIRLCKSSTPYVCGVFHPILVLPEDNIRPGEPIIVHELLHRKWRDVLVNIGLGAVRAVNWFNPVIWILTSVVQNDSEALCDQRVLEYYKEDMQCDYGEMLLAMARNRKQNCLRTGTSNMAGSYRNMRTRIRRICDFRKVPGGIGFVAFCITLMLAVAGISTSAEAHCFEIVGFETEAGLERELLKAQLYHAHTPEEAVYLFLRAVVERNVFYRIAVMPQEDTRPYEEFVRMCRNQGRLDERGRLIAESNLTVENMQSEEQGSYARYFPEEISSVQHFRIYNLLCDESQGTAIVCVWLRPGEEGETYVEWRLALTKEKGWKVQLVEESGRKTGEYEEPAMLYDSVRLGDFGLEMSAYNEAYFSQLDQMAGGGMVYGFYVQGAEKSDAFPEFFSMEYRISEYDITYFGKESLEGHLVRVEILEDGAELPEVTIQPELLEERMAAFEQRDYSFHGEGVVICELDGGKLTFGNACSAGGGGTGFSQSGSGWKPDERVCVQVRIYVDGSLVEEGELWSGDR